MGFNRSGGMGNMVRQAQAGGGQPQPTGMMGRIRQALPGGGKPMAPADPRAMPPQRGRGPMTPKIQPQMDRQRMMAQQMRGGRRPPNPTGGRMPMNGGPRRMR